MKRLLGLVGLVVCLSAMLSAQTRDLPTGWFRAGSKPGDYEMGVDPAGGRTGGAAFIKSKPGTLTPDSFGTAMQQITAAEYRGKRLRLSAYVKAVDVANWAGLWMRVDGQPAASPLAFDNMQNRPIKGTQDWRRCDIVLDVQAPSVQIAFGVLLSGAGQVWFDDLHFEVVGTDVPTTSIVTSSEPSRPLNLDFNQ